MTYAPGGSQVGRVIWRIGSERFHIDHKRPVARGGQDELANLQVAHVKCNLRKSDHYDA